MSLGVLTGVLVGLLVTAMHFMRLLCEILWPVEDIEICPDIMLNRDQSVRARENKRVVRDKIVE
jgi:hypothetical protein